MRIRIRHRPPVASVDGLQLDRFETGRLYEVGTMLGTLMLAEGWAEPVIDDEEDADDSALRAVDAEPAPQHKPPPQERRSFASERRRIHSDAPPNLIRDTTPPYADRLSMAADFNRPPRRR